MLKTVLTVEMTHNFFGDFIDVEKTLHPEYGSVVEAVFQAVRRHPNRVAIIEDGRELSYGQLASLVITLASRLNGEGECVGVLVTRSANTVVALLAVLVAGGVYCPIDPLYPSERQRTMLQAAGCTSMIATSTQHAVPDGIRVVAVPEADGSDAPLEEGQCHFPKPSTPAYILFTSGSTGAPKGVITPHRALAAAVHSLREFLAITASDRVLQFASLSWDTCFEEIFPTLTSGATLVIDNEVHTGLFARWFRAINARQVSVINVPTAFWHELVLYMKENGNTLPKSVRIVVIGGEAVRSARLSDWRGLHTGSVRLINTYGATETTLVTHATDLHGPSTNRAARNGVAPIGKCLPHVVEHVAETGELLIGGPSLALGYLNRPDLDDTRFVQLEPCGVRRRYFRSGDRVERLETGDLLHRGRLDNEIKVRGIRIDPGEVEAAIAAHPDVNGVAVVGSDVGDHTSLIAYVVPRTLSVVGESDEFCRAVAAWLRARLPSHLVPSKFCAVENLIFTSSGKVDRLGLHHHYSKPRQTT